MKCTWKWVIRILGLTSAEIALTIPFVFSLTCRTGPCLAGAIVGIYGVSSVCVVALAVQETVKWFVVMVGEMKECITK